MARAMARARASPMSCDPPVPGHALYTRNKDAITSSRMESFFRIDPIIP